MLPRSGLATKQGLTLINAPGLIDAGYRGEVKWPWSISTGSEPVKIARGDRIAQLVVVALPGVEPAIVDELSDTERGEGGFGSCGS